MLTLRLNNPPVNGLSKDFLINLADSFKKAEEDTSVRGILLSSALNGKVFCGGLHIPDLCNKYVFRLVIIYI